MFPVYTGGLCCVLDLCILRLVQEKKLEQTKLWWPLGRIWFVMKCSKEKEAWLQRHFKDGAAECIGKCALNCGGRETRFSGWVTPLNSFQREERRLRSTATSGPRSQPRRCSGSPKSWWRRSDKVRLMHIIRPVVADPPSLQRRGLPEADLWRHSSWRFDLCLSSQEMNYWSFTLIGVAF